MKTICIIQARMGSERLPGKVLKLLNGRPMLGHILDRVKMVGAIDSIYVATTSLPEDDPIEDLCAAHNVSVYRGSRDDVLSRYYDIAAAEKADVVVRITGDCPLVHPQLIDTLISFFHEHDYDYVSPRVNDEDLIRGLDVEVFSFRSLEKAYTEGHDPRDREHVTYFIYSHPHKFKIYKYTVEEIYKCHPENIRLCVDTPEDFQLISEIYNHLYRPGDIVDTDAAIAWVRQSPQLLEINAGIRQKRV